MPSVNIYEKDLTTSNGTLTSDIVAYVPGVFGENGDESLVDTPTLCSSLAEFERKFGRYTTQILNTNLENNIGWIYAHTLLGLGLKVLYEVPSKTGEVGTACKTKDEIIAVLKKAEFWAKLADKDMYDFTFLTSGGIVDDEGTISGNMVGIAGESSNSSKRDDIIVLFDHKKDATAENVKEMLKTPSGTYVAKFSPWCKFEIPGCEGDVILPGSFAYLNAFATAGSQEASWLARAGAQRGLISYLKEPLIKFTAAQRDALLARDSENGAINPITLINPYGYLVWGNRTNLQNDTSTGDGLKASSFLNIRVGLCGLKKIIHQASRRLTYEQLDDLLWVKFKNLVTPYLDKMLYGRGVRGYKLIRIDSVKKATLECKVLLLPIEAVEDFEISIELRDSFDSVREGE